jgi:hypothetical protein
MLKWFWATFAIVAVAFCALSALMMWFALRSSSLLQNEAHAYVDKTLPDVLREWEPKRLIGVAAPELVERNGEAAIRTTFAAMRERLGPLQSYDGSTIDAVQAPSKAGQGSFFVAMATAKATFARGPADVKVKVIRREGRWQYADFRVEGNGR